MTGCCACSCSRTAARQLGRCSGRRQLVIHISLLGLAGLYCWAAADAASLCWRHATLLCPPRPSLTIQCPCPSSTSTQHLEAGNSAAAQHDLTLYVSARPNLVSTRRASSRPVQ
jgi:hypothetical protein